MIERRIKPVTAMGYTKFYLDFLAEQPSARNLFVADNLDTVAAAIDRKQYDRVGLGEILRRQNQVFGAATPALDKSVAQTFGKIDFLLKGVEGKAFASHKKKSTEKRERIYRVHNAIFPNRTLQERSLNILYFLARYGNRFVSYLIEQIDGEDRAHQVIDMTEYSQGR